MTHPMDVSASFSSLESEILYMAEVKTNYEKINHRKNRFMFYNFGETQGHKDVGFMVKDYLKDRMLAFKGLSERAAILQLKAEKNKVLTTN